MVVMNDVISNASNNIDMNAVTKAEEVNKLETYIGGLKLQVQHIKGEET